MANKHSTEDTETLRRELATLNQTLEANNVSLEEAQALTHLGSWQWNVATGEISWSDELYRIYGLKPQERQIGFEEFLQLIHPEDRERIGGIIGEAYQTGKPFQFEHRIVLPNKKIRILSGKGKAVTNAKGEIIRMLGTSQDITERKKADQALYLSDERFKAVTAATHDVVYDVDMQSNTIWFNDELRTGYGYPRSKKAKTADWLLGNIHPEDRQRIDQAITKLLKGKATTWTEDYRFKKYDGTYIDVRDRAYVLRDVDGKPLRMIGSILDITQQKELERAKDKFISLVSHQLRTPLTAMRLLTDMLSNGQVGELTNTQQEYISKIGTSTVRMIQLVGDILNVSQIERGRLKVVPVDTDISALIQWHIDEVKPLAIEKDVRIAYSPATGIPAIAVDPILFSQIIHNLLTNAIRYTVKKGTVITVSFTKSKAGYTLCVKDQGIGVPAAAQSRVFSSFFRADNAVRVHGEGTGLGLYLIKLIMEATGGKAWFESEEGTGTAFYVSLPRGGMKVKAGDKTLEQESYEQ
jgi:PAS domain S-box-containing protein